MKVFCNLNDYMINFLICLSFCAAPKKPPTQPPVDPVVKNKTETSVTLGWSPPKLDRPIPIDGYVVERKKLTGFTWVRCHESHVPVPEFTVSNLAEEADYQFRVSAVNAHGQSPYLEFPGSMHLGEHKTPREMGQPVLTSHCGALKTFPVSLRSTEQHSKAFFLRF